MFTVLKNWLKSFYWPVVAASFFLTALGCLELFSLAGEDLELFYRQLIFLILGLGIMFVASLFDFRVVREKSWVVLVLYLVCLGAVAGLEFAGTEIRGVRKWYKIGGINVDPVQPLKLFFIILLAKAFSSTGSKTRILVKSFFYFVFPVGLIVYQPDFGSVIVLACLWVGMLFVFGLSHRKFLFLLLISLLVLVFVWQNILLPYQKSRVISFLNPEAQIRDEGYNLRQSLIAIGHGGLLGQGINSGSQTQLQFLPEPESDFIVSALAEELGFLGVFFLIVMWAGLVFAVVRVGFLSQDRFGYYLCLGTAFWIFSQGLLNIAVVSGLFPVVGISFPFVSYGGSALLSLFLALGVVQSVYKRREDHLL